MKSSIVITDLGQAAEEPHVGSKLKSLLLSHPPVIPNPSNLKLSSDGWWLACLLSTNVLSFSSQVTFHHCVKERDRPLERGEPQRPVLLLLVEDNQLHNVL